MAQEAGNSICGLRGRDRSYLDATVRHPRQPVTPDRYGCSMVDYRGEAHVLLEQIAGPGARFRSGQWEAIDALVNRRGKALVVQRTGWGKSAVYIIATRLLRERGAGATVIVSPLLALMRNQIDMAARAGVRAETVNSANRDDWDGVFERIERREVDLVLISPERLANPRFVEQVGPHLFGQMGLLVVDEVHCISDWGHDFRPDYRRLARLVSNLAPGVPVLGTTATANDRVIADVAEQLGDDLLISRGTLDRESLALQVIDLPGHAERMAWLATHIPGLPGSGIVYCLTIRDANRVGDWLASQGIAAKAYTGQTEEAERLAIEAELDAGDLKVVVATSALGMGYDNPHVHFVVHYQSPGSPIAYYQQVGRAGRAVDAAYGVLLTGKEDRDIQDYFIDTAFPAERHVTETLALLTEAPRKRSELLRHVNIAYGRLDAMLKVLEVEGAVFREHSTWHRSAHAWTYPRERVASVTAARRREQQAMVAYAAGRECLMEALRHQLDDAGAGPCGRCAVCSGRGLPETYDESLLAIAAGFLRRTDIPIAARKRWSAELGFPAPKDVQLDDGIALSFWGDPGYGDQVRTGKYRDGAFSTALVQATAQMIERWARDPAPEWITAIPSHRHPDLVPRLAMELSQTLGLPYIQTLRTRGNLPQQKEMANSELQARNARGSLDLLQPVHGSGLLIDDIVDSGWTLTIAGLLLKGAGATHVYPVVLANASKA